MHKFLIMLLAIAAYGCADTDTQEILLYEGPQQEVENVELFYTEQDILKAKMQAKLLYEHQNGDREFPEGVYIEFYDALGKLSSILSAQQAYFIKEEDKWRARGNVEVKNVEKNEQLNTEELFWTPKDQKIFTEKFVTIRQQKDVIYGEGLNATQDLSSYRIHKPTGTIEIDE